MRDRFAENAIVAAPLGRKLLRVIGKIMTVLGLTIAECLGVASFAYILAIASFNAGYFSNIPSRFVELFAFADIVNSNIPILQYIIGLYFVYWMLAAVLYVPKKLLDKGADKLIARYTLPNWTLELIGLVAFIVVGGACFWLSHILDQANNTSVQL